MYFDGVNRGLQFTKPGFYITGLVMLLGFVATGSGYNGFFLALGFGLSLLVISGLLSEKTMQHAECTGLGEISAEPAQPFTVRFFVHNRSRSWHVFGVDYSVSAERPRFGLLSRKFHSLMEAQVPALGPDERQDAAGRCEGLKRGIYREFYLVQSTLFPFGMLLKFKIQKVACRIRVLPAWDLELAAEVRKKLARRLSIGEGQEFWSHRLHLPSDSVRNVDWKKSAGLPPAQWVVKVMRQPSEASSVLLDWDVFAAPAAPDYERQLSAVRTAAEVVASLGLNVYLQTERGTYFSGLEAILDRLSGAPIFEKRKERGKESSSEPPQEKHLTLVLRDHLWDWDDPSHGTQASAE